MSESWVSITVDETLCVGVGECELLEPEVIVVGDDGLAQPTGVRLPLARAQKLCDQCPARAIAIVDPDDG